MIGINDAWRTFNQPHRTAAHIGEAEFRANLRDIAQRTLPFVRRLVLISPYYIEPNRADPMRERMDRFRAIVKEEAERCGAAYMDTQEAFDRLVPAYDHTSAQAWDRVHPEMSGHMLIADAVYAELCGE